MIAQVGGLTYSLPNRQRVGEQQVAGGQAQMAPQQQGGSPFDIPLAESGVPTIENYTRNYYDSYSKLKDFTETMWKDYGVDVTKPDFSQPGGGLLHEAFQKMDADLRIAANDLAESKTILAEERKAQLEGKAIEAQGYDPYAQIAREVPQGQRMVPLGLAEDVQQAVQGVSNKQYNTPNEVKRADATLQPLRDRYTQLMTTDPENAAYYQRQIDALRVPTYSTPDVAFRPPSGARTGDTSYYATMAKKIARDFGGYWEKVDGVSVDPATGKTISYVIPESGLSLGKTTIAGKSVDKIVKRYEKDQQGSVYAVFENPSIPKERLDSKSADEAVTTIMSNNPKLGGAEGIKYLNKFRSKGGGYTLSDLYEQDLTDYEEALQSRTKTTEFTKQKQNIYENVKKDMNAAFPTKSTEIKSSGLWNIPQYQTIKIQMRDLFSKYPYVAERLPSGYISKNLIGDKYSIPSDVFSNIKANMDKEVFKSIVGKSGNDSLTKDQIISLLSDYVSDIITESQTVTPTSSYSGLGSEFLK